MGSTHFKHVQICYGGGVKYFQAIISGPALAVASTQEGAHRGSTHSEIRSLSTEALCIVSIGTVL